MIIGQGAGVILISKNGSILLQHRDSRNRWNKDSWSEFGGQIEEGEDPEETAKRELLEELGIEISDLEFFKKYNLQREKGVYVQFIFIAHINYAIEDLRKRQKEGDNLGFFSAEEIKTLKMADYTREALANYFKK